MIKHQFINFGAELLFNSIHQHRRHGHAVRAHPRAAGARDERREVHGHDLRWGLDREK